MKYAIASTLALILCIAAGIGSVQWISAKRAMKLITKILLSAAVSISLIAVALLVYLEVYYHADAEADEYLKSANGVKVSESEDAYCFDGPGESEAIVFWPGAKVEETAYAPLMFRLAEQGTDCYLLKLPFRMAIFAPNAADVIIDNHHYDHWYTMGHSLGGIVASEYNASNARTTDGSIMLASHPTAPIPNSESFLSIYGSKDGCLSRDEYREARGFWPKRRSELIIEGGNHAGFGYYGPQKGDGEAGITPYEQQGRTIQAIEKFIAP